MHPPRKTATSLTLAAASAITAFAITAHIAFPNLQVTGWILTPTGTADATITRSSRPRRTPAAKNRPATAAASARRRHRAPHPAGSLAAAPDATPAEHETIEEYVGA